MAITPGTVISGTSTIDAIFNDLFAGRANLQGTVVYSWSDPVTIMGLYADSSCVLAHFESRDLGATMLQQGAVTTPTVTSVAPNTVVHGAGNTAITVTGTNFVSTAVIYVGGTALTTGFTNATTLTATILAAQLVSAGTLAVVVQNPDGQMSNMVFFTVT